MFMTLRGVVLGMLYSSKYSVLLSATICICRFSVSRKLYVLCTYIRLFFSVELSQTNYDDYRMLARYCYGRPINDLGLVS